MAQLVLTLVIPVVSIAVQILPPVSGLAKPALQPAFQPAVAVNVLARLQRVNTCVICVDIRYPGC